MNQRASFNRYKTHLSKEKVNHGNDYTETLMNILLSLFIYDFFMLFL